MSEQFVTVLNSAGATKTVPTVGALKGYPVNIGQSGSLKMQTAGVWMKRAEWVVPAGYVFRPCSASASVTTAGSDTWIVTGKKLALWHSASQTGVYSGTGYETFTSPFFGGRLIGVVTQQYSLADTVTLQYLNQVGASSDTRSSDSAGAGVSGGTTIPSGALIHNAYEFTLDALDFGVQDVQYATGTATPPGGATGRIDIWGVNTILRTLGVSNALESATLNTCLEIPEGDSIFIFMQAAATTTQVRSAQLHGYLLPST